jgi:two-component sensor histidine kinase
MRPAALLIALFSFHVLSAQPTESNIKAQWFNRALVAKAVGKTDSILDYLEKAESIADTNMQRNKLPILIQLEKAKYARSKEDVSLFLKSIKKAEDLIQADTSHALSDELFALKAQYHLYIKEYDKALVFLQQAEEYRKIHAPFKNWKTYRLMAAVYKAKEDNGKAKEFNQKSETLAEIQGTLKNVSETEFAPALKTHEMTQIQLENALIHNQNTTIQAQKRQLKMALVFCGIIIALLIYFLLQRNKWNRILNEKNNIIEKNLKEKELLLQEIHHRVKNNLQLISSLLSLQSRSVDDKAATQALQEGQARVQSMALIHKNLYNDNVSSGLEVRDYVIQLTQQLLQTYGLNPDQVELQLDVDPISLDVSTLVPLALIINELITNSLKYAFDQHEAGKIRLSLKPTENNKLLLQVQDNGKGFNHLENSDGFGTKLISALAAKLDATVNYLNQNGTLVEVMIANYKLVP